MFSSSSALGPSAMVPEPALLSAQDLLDALEGQGPRLLGQVDGRLTGIFDHSDDVGPGSVFVVRGGQKHDGQNFAEKARASGASLLLTSRGSALRGPRIEVDDVPRALGILAQKFWGDPSHALLVLGITGTNGKTTVAHLIEQVLLGLNHGVARIGTLGFFVNGRRQAESLTTPGAVDLARTLAIARDQRARFCVMEVSSHALAQERVRGVRFQGAAFTNLSQDHLDYHGTMAAYGAEKAKLFFAHEPGLSSINIDDPFGQTLALELARSRPDLRLARFSCAGRADAEIRSQDVQFRASGLAARVSAFGRECSLKSPLVGAHNLENLLAALGLLIAAGIELDVAVDGLSRARSAPGRLERVSELEDDVTILVDYAHTPAALEGVLRSLRIASAGPITCVFGCGGDRDKGKRPLMGRIASELSARVIITTDNARSEDPATIAREIASGIASHSYQIVLDRRDAIFEAITSAPPGSTVLLAGKGHESSQTIGAETLPFDDGEEARAALVLRRSGPQGKGG